MNQDTGISPRRAPGRSIILVACALVVAFVGVFWLLGSVVARDHGIGAGVQPTPTVAAGTGMRGHLAPVFTLTDQNGTSVSLQSLRGHLVVLTFLDATCTEQCPIMVQYLNATPQFLGQQKTAEVEWVAISVNPNNTPAQATAFLAKNKPVMRVRFLLGTQTQLAPLWKGYYIGVEPGQSDVVHTSGLYVIDQQGREREWVDMPFDAKALSADLQTLLSK